MPGGERAGRQGQVNELPSETGWLTQPKSADAQPHKPGVQDWPRHGQWRLDHIAPDAYETVDTETAVDVVHSWANQHGDVPESLASRLRQEIYTPICKATSRYLLGQLPEDAFHDYGPIHIDYHELVLIDRPAATLTLLVAADD
ncbi:hypothetical protein [Streptomyces sp. NPDC001880]